jgi:hypothetical protein
MKQSVNLVPESFRRSVVAQQLMRHWTVAGIVVGTVLSAYVFWERETYRQIFTRRAVMESKARPFSEMKDSTDRMVREIRKLEESDALVRRLSRDQTPLLPLALVSAGVKACPDQLWIKHVKFEQRAKIQPGTNGAKELTASKPNEASDQETIGFMTLEGFAVDNLAVAAFVAALRDTKGFRSVELKSSINSDAQDLRRTSFTIESEL